MIVGAIGLDLEVYYRLDWSDRKTFADDRIGKSRLQVFLALPYGEIIDRDVANQQRDFRVHCDDISFMLDEGFFSDEVAYVFRGARVSVRTNFGICRGTAIGAGMIKSAATAMGMPPMKIPTTIVIRRTVLALIAILLPINRHILAMENIVHTVLAYRE